MNKLGINLWNWVPGISSDCLGLPDKIKKMGFTAIELPMTESRISSALKEEILGTGLEVSLCAALGSGRDLSNFDSAVRESTMQYMTECLKTGASVGAKVFAGPLYAGGGKRHWLSESEKKREWEFAVKGIRELSRRAEEYGINLALEPLNRYRTSVINTVDQVIVLLKDIDCKNVGIHYDTFHAALEEADLLQSLDHALASGKVMHVHACANNRGGPGQGVLPWDDILRKLSASEYNGHVTMETFAPGGLDASWINVHGLPDEVAEKGISYLKKYFK